VTPKTRTRDDYETPNLYIGAPLQIRQWWFSWARVWGLRRSQNSSREGWNILPPTEEVAGVRY